MFSFSTPGQQPQQQQQQPQHQLQQTPQNQGQQQQLQQQGNNGSPLTLGHLSRPGQSQTQLPNQFGGFGASPAQQGFQPQASLGSVGQAQQQQQATSLANQQLQQQYQPHTSWASPSPAQSQLHPTPPAQQAPVSYVPGYLSKLRSTRPYASPSRGSEGHSPPGRDGEGGGQAHTNANTSTDSDAPGGSSSRTGPSSPPTRFSWSSGSRAGTAEPDRERSAWPAGPQSVFGASGLRGSRRTPGRGVSATPGLQHSVSSSRLRTTTSPGGVDMDDDDDAPPIEGLTEMDTASQLHSPIDQTSSFSSQSPFPDTPSRPNAEPFNPFTSTPAANSSTSHGGLSTSGALATPAKDATFPATMRTVLVYGFPTALTHAVLEHFGHMGDIVNRQQVSGEDGNAGTGSVAGVECISITYAQPWSALRALRRSGETVVGACHVGVRWQDDNLHREALLNGLNAAAFATSNSLAPSSSSASIAPSASTASLSGTGTGAGARSALTPTFGRPISVVGTPSAALRTNSSASNTASPSPFAGLASNLFTGGGAKSNSAVSTPVRGGSVPPVSLFTANNSPAVGAKGQDVQGQEQKSGLMGRIEGAIFGW